MRLAKTAQGRQDGDVPRFCETHPKGRGKSEGPAHGYRSTSLSHQHATQSRRNLDQDGSSEPHLAKRDQTHSNLFPGHPGEARLLVAVSVCSSITSSVEGLPCCPSMDLPLLCSPKTPLWSLFAFSSAPVLGVALLALVALTHHRALGLYPWLQHRSRRRPLYWF